MSDWHNEHDAAVLQHIASRLDEEGAWDRARRVRLALDHIAHLASEVQSRNMAQNSPKSPQSD